MLVIFFKQKTAYEMRISDWSSDVCSSDLFPLDSDFQPSVSHPRSVVSSSESRGGSLHRKAPCMPTNELRPSGVMASPGGLASMSLGIQRQTRREIGRASGREGVCQ